MTSLLIYSGWGVREAQLVSRRDYPTREQADLAAGRYLRRHRHLPVNHYTNTCGHEFVTIAPGGQRWTISVVDDPIISMEGEAS